MDYTGGIITSSGNKAFIITCTDSRGRTSKQVVTDALYFTPYSPPKVIDLSVSKDTKNDDNATNDRMVATAVWEYDTVGGKNSTTAVIYYKLSSASDWTLHSGQLSSGSAFTLSNLTPDELSSYNFKVVVTDLVGNSSEKDAFSSTIAVLLDFKAGGDGLGVGKICENPGMEVAMKTTFYDSVYVGGKTLEEYIRSTMQILSSEMYGDIAPQDAIQNPAPGQIYFKRV